jgi:hypothetical protein
VAWPTICRSQDLGGLGVVDLRRAGVALRLRWEWKQRVAPDLGCTALHHSTEKMVSAIFRAATVSYVGSGESTFFWTDNWIEGDNIQAMAPTLFRAVMERQRKAFVSDALPGNAWVRHITGAFTA